MRKLSVYLLALAITAGGCGKSTTVVVGGRSATSYVVSTFAAKGLCEGFERQAPNEAAVLHALSAARVLGIALPDTALVIEYLKTEVQRGSRTEWYEFKRARALSYLGKPPSYRDVTRLRGGQRSDGGWEDSDGSRIQATWRAIETLALGRDLPVSPENAARFMANHLHRDGRFVDVAREAAADSDEVPEGHVWLELLRDQGTVAPRATRHPGKRP